MADAPETNAAVTGIGLSEIARPSHRSALDLTLDACISAIADAGLEPRDIDALLTYPGAYDDDTGFAPVGLHEVRLALGLELQWYNAIRECAGQLGAVFNAIAVVAGGFARHALVFRTVTEASARIRARENIAAETGPRPTRGWHEWTAPFNADAPANWFALQASRHFHEFGTRPEQLAQIALNARRNAALNPAAIYRSPLTMDEYLSARMISSPLRLYDCDVPVDASVALIVSSLPASRDLRHPLLQFQAIGTALDSRDTWVRPESLTRTGAFDAAKSMWARTSLKPADVEVAQLYDGFSIQTLHWLEALGFCGYGESGAYIEGGQRIALNGELPLNTFGGQLAAGRVHGLGFLHEACVQLWGRGGERQVAPQPRVAVISTGDVGFAGCALLTRP